MIDTWAMQKCEECDGIGEIETEIFNSQPPDWRVIDCYECEGVGETMQPNEEGDNDE
jgi:hypothetical protein